MISKLLLREAILAGILFIGGLCASAGLLRRSFAAENHLDARRLEETAASLIEKAHRLKDDLLMQEIIQALARAPGVALACVVDGEGKVLSHNQPAELGKPFQLPPLAGKLWTRPLRQDQERWGTLIFTTSVSSTRKFWLEQLLLQIGLAGLLWLCFVGRSLAWERQLQKAQAALVDSEALLAEEKGKQARQEERYQESQRAGLKWLQSAVDSAPQGLVLLDQRQRVVAANRRGARCLGLEEGTSLAGKSWHEVPRLGSCGNALEKSLASPGQPVEWSSEADDLRLQFETDKDGISGTWITFV
jgi:PAS domain-containing protein